MPKFSREDVENLSVLVVGLANARKLGKAPDSATTERLAKLSPDVAQKLLRVGLIDPSFCGAPVPTLAELCADYCESRQHLKKRTLLNDEQSTKKLLAFFTGKLRVDQIAKARAEDYRSWLLKPKSEGGRGLAIQSVNREIKRRRTIFKRAIDSQALRVNPFSKAKAGASVNKKRKEYVPRERILKILNALEPCDAELRFLVAVARFGGFRIPSEIEELKVSDVGVQSGVDSYGDALGVRVPEEKRADGSAKTGGRWVPLFPDLRAEWERCRATLPRGCEYVFPTLRLQSESAAYSKLKRRLKRMGESGWRVLFHSLRTSCMTDIKATGVSESSLNAWFGNSEAVRREHYSQARPDDMARALGFSSNAQNRAPDFTPFLPSSVPSALTTSTFSPFATATDFVVSGLSLLRSLGRKAAQEAEEIREQLDDESACFYGTYGKCKEEVEDFEFWRSEQKKKAERLETLGFFSDYTEDDFYKDRLEIGTIYPQRDSNSRPTD